MHKNVSTPNNKHPSKNTESYFIKNPFSGPKKGTQKILPVILPVNHIIVAAKLKDTLLVATAYRLVT